MSATPSTDAADAPRKKHRHDLGQEDHGPKIAIGTTRAIQTLLGLWIAVTLGLVVWVLVDGGRPRPVSGTGPTSEAAHP